ncbi:MAG: energy-coupling factor transporter transmembrane protein EcfT [Micrococcales bacterium]|nr:energy-coupling factor transporter transmembrane protein EcfT [Micrococcales bacterium]MCL2666596.1 energy-coupling factor transporter transmembrane protein EcfT [Micrococcales bacterium]
MTVPGWLVADEPNLPAYEPNGQRRRRGFLEATADQSAQVLRQVVVADETAARRGLLQRLDPRGAAVAMVAVLVVLALVHHVVVLLAAWALVLGLALASHVPLRQTSRAWVLVPVFAAFVAAPATLSVVRAGDVVVTLWTWHGTGHGLTSQGLTAAALLVTRAGCSVSVVLTITATTSWNRLFAALGSLGVPRVFCMVLSMAHRYLVLVTGVVADMVTSRQVRTVAGVRHDRTGRAVLGASVGALVGKSHLMADEVHQAMVARGYRGHTRTLQTFRFGLADLVAVLVLVATLGGLLVWDGALG